MAAPSAGNQQAWRFVVVRDREVLRAIADASPYAAMLPAAPVAIVVCADVGVERHMGFWVQDCSAAVQNMLLAARAIGLGGVWLGYHPVRERTDGIVHALGLPPDVMPLAVVPFGHPAQTPPPADRYDPTYVHQDRW
jgi:nitroreductase